MTSRKIAFPSTCSLQRDTNNDYVTQAMIGNIVHRCGNGGEGGGGLPNVVFPTEGEKSETTSQPQVVTPPECGSMSGRTKQREPCLFYKGYKEVYTVQSHFKLICSSNNIMVAQCRGGRKEGRGVAGVRVVAVDVSVFALAF